MRHIKNDDIRKQVPKKRTWSKYCTSYFVLVVAAVASSKLKINKITTSARTLQTGAGTRGEVHFCSPENVSLGTSVRSSALKINTSTCFVCVSLRS